MQDARGHEHTFNKSPAILVDGRPAFAGLPRTEEIEAWLRARFPRAFGAPTGIERHD